MMPSQNEGVSCRDRHCADMVEPAFGCRAEIVPSPTHTPIAGWRQPRPQGAASRADLQRNRGFARGDISWLTGIARPQDRAEDSPLAESEQEGRRTEQQGTVEPELGGHVADRLSGFDSNRQRPSRSPRPKCRRGIRRSRMNTKETPTIRVGHARTGVQVRYTGEPRFGPRPTCPADVRQGEVSNGSGVSSLM